MPRTRLAAIVEGDGEVEALPVLLRTWAPGATTLRPIRVNRDKFMRDVEYQRRYVSLAVRQGATRLLVLLDAHDDCAVDAAASLTQALAVETPIPVAVVMAVKEYETWFLQCLPEFAPHVGFHEAEAVSGAKERVKRYRGRYTPTADQATLTAGIAAMWYALEPTQIPKSLSKLYREVQGLLT